MAKKTTTPKKVSNHVVARHDDGTVQITLIIPWSKVEKERTHAAEHMANDITVPGFRKGKAPISKVMEKINEEKLIEHTLSHILPEMFSEAVEKEKLRPAIYPKYNLTKAKPNEDWEVVATTCEVPTVELGDYKKIVKTIKFDKKAKEAPTKEEKEDKVIGKLIESYEIKIPRILTDEEVNSRLASLLERLEKLGLSLENYLASMKKTGEDLRNDYAAQADKAIKLDLILQYISVEEKIEIKDEEVVSYMQTGSVSPEQKEMVTLFLRKRKALESLTGLI